MRDYPCIIGQSAGPTRRPNIVFILSDDEDSSNDAAATARANRWKWPVAGLVVVTLAAGTAWLMSSESAEEVILEDMDDLAYRYRLLQRKKFEGQDWLDQAEPLKARSDAVEQAIGKIEVPRPELVDAATTLSDVLERPKRPDPRIEEIDRRLEAARQAIAQAD
jgi:hypothetical protein